MSPHYKLKKVKELLKKGHIQITPNTISAALNDFGWRTSDIIRCLLKLNCRHHLVNPDRNHFHKSEPSRKDIGIIMDFYKAKYIMEGKSVYTHFYIDEGSDTLIINSFKEL